MVWLSLASKVARSVFWEDVYLKWLDTKVWNIWTKKCIFSFNKKKEKQTQKGWTRHLLPVMSIRVRISCVLSAIGRTRCPRQSLSFWFTVPRIRTCPFPSPASCMNSFSHKLSKWNVLWLEHFFGGVTFENKKRVSVWPILKIHFMLYYSKDYQMDSNQTWTGSRIGKICQRDDLGPWAGQ